MGIWILLLLFIAVGLFMAVSFNADARRIFERARDRVVALVRKVRT